MAADGFGTVIPLQGPQGSEGLEKKLDPFFKTVLMWRQWLKQSLKDQGNSDKVANLMQRLTKNSDKTTKEVTDQKKLTIKDKLDKWFKKWYIDNKLFEMQWQDIKNRAKDGGWLKKLLGFMALLAILGPKTVINIIKMIGGIFISLIKMFAEFLPIMIDAFIEFIIMLVPLIGDLLLALVQTFWNILSKYGKDFWNNLKAGNLGGAMKSILAIILFLTTMGFVMKWLWGIMGPFQPMLKMLGKAFWQLGLTLFRTLFPNLTAMITTMVAQGKAMAMAMLANPMTWIILAIVAALAALWAWAEPISKFFDDLINGFKNLSWPMKALAVVLGIIFWPISLVVGIIYALVKAFKRIKEVGFKNFMKELWAKIKEGLKAVFNWENIKSVFKSIGSTLWDGLKWLLTTAGQAIKDVALWIWEGVKGLFTKIKDSFDPKKREKNMKKEVTKKVLEDKTGIDTDVYEVADRLRQGGTVDDSEKELLTAALSSVGLDEAKLNKLNDKTRDQALQMGTGMLAKTIEDAGDSFEKFTKLMKERGGKDSRAYKKVFDRVKALKSEK